MLQLITADFLAKGVGRRGVVYQLDEPNGGLYFWAGGAFSGLTTAQIAAVLAGSSAPVSISAPGGLGPGSTLTALIGQGWSIDAYQWTRNDAAIAGEVTSTHNIVALDAGTVVGAQGLRVGTLIYTGYLAIPGVAFNPNQVFFNGDAIYFNSQSVGFS